MTDLGQGADWSTPAPDAIVRALEDGAAPGMLTSASTRMTGLVDPDAVNDLVAEHMVGRVNNGHRIWTLLTLEVFRCREGW